MQIAACALLVTAGSYWMFPKTFIYFGVLHGMLVMLIIVRLTVPMRHWLWVIGAMVVLAGWMAGQLILPADVAVLLNSKSLNWLGWVTHKPYTEDYVPLLPWLGVMGWGAAAGASAMQRKVRWLSLPHRSSTVLQWLAKLGRWSLSFYMIHQPLMIGALMGFAWIVSQR